MKFFKRGKDGGPDSTVTGYWLVEIKGLFSIVLLKFEGDSREVYHTHAFNSISWLLKGLLWEFVYEDSCVMYRPSIKPIITTRARKHMVDSLTDVSWVLSFRGPWADRWLEFDPEKREYTVLTDGRKRV